MDIEMRRALLDRTIDELARLTARAVVNLEADLETLAGFEGQLTVVADVKLVIVDKIAAENAAAPEPAICKRPLSEDERLPVPFMPTYSNTQRMN